jgi:hypothetical protein
LEFVIGGSAVGLAGTCHFFVGYDGICGATIDKFTLKPELNKPLLYRVYDNQESEMSRLGCTSPPPHHVPGNYNPREWKAYCQQALGDPHGTSNEVGGHFVNGV